MQPLEHGFWKDENSRPGWEKVNGYLDFAVSNYEFHKKMAVKVTVTRENGVKEEFLHRPRYKGKLPDGRERWGVDNLSFYPDAGHHGKVKDVQISYLVQANVDADRDRETCQSQSSYHLASYADLASPKTGLGALKPAGDNPEFGVHELDTSGAKGASTAFKDTVEAFVTQPDDGDLCAFDGRVRPHQCFPHET